jgi:hypothetical protein
MTTDEQEKRIVAETTVDYLTDYIRCLIVLQHKRSVEGLAETSDARDALVKYLTGDALE